MVMSLADPVHKDHLSPPWTHLHSSSFYDTNIPYILICSCENPLRFIFFQCIEGILVSWQGFLLFFVVEGCVCVCFTGGSKLPSQISPCHSSHALEGSLDSWQHVPSRFVGNGMRKFTHNKAAANRHWSQKSITKGQITASMWQTARKFVLSCEREIQSICFHTATTAITLFSAIYNSQIVSVKVWSSLHHLLCHSLEWTQKMCPDAHLILRNDSKLSFSD